MSTSGRAETNPKIKNNKSKKKTDDIFKLSPTHSDLEEKITFKAIDGEDIQNLAIKDEDLKKLKKPSEKAVETKEKPVLVKKVDKNNYPKVEVKVAKLAPDRPVKPIDVSDNLGIRFDKYGNCVPYSILGTVEDFLQEAVSNGKSIELPYDTLDSDRPKADSYIQNEKESKTTLKLSGDGGEKALKNWKDKMVERRSIQDSLSKVTNRPIDGLVMNQSDKAQQISEIKTLIDRTLPLVEHGKGYRLGSEFWNQPKLIGNEETGIFTTLKKSEQGVLPQIEQIAKPLSILKESDFTNNQPPVANYPWDKSKYLNQRLKNLDPLIKELVPHRAQFSRLELIGKNPFISRKDDEVYSNRNSSEQEVVVDDTWVNNDVLNKNKENISNPYFIDIDEDETDILASHPDVVQGPIFGPCIIFGGQTANWTGNDDENAGIVALESRLNFDTKAGKRVLATFEIHNIGTTSIYYDWKKIPDSNPFEIINSKVQRFYFDCRSNVILPGDLLKMHIVFKSSKGGIFTEKWEFVTHPKLLSSASLVLTLRGVASQEDKFKKNRHLIERQLFNREKEIIVESIIELILSGVRTPDRCGTPENAYVTEEDLFLEKNPEFYYDHETVQELKKLYLEMFDESERLSHENEWNLSLNDFKQKIMNLNDSEDSNKQNLLFKLNNLISNISFPTYVPISSKMYTACYNILCSSIDEIFSELNLLKTNLNLPLYLPDEPYQTVDEFDKRYEDWKKEFEIFKQIELEKKNRLEKEKGKDNKGKKAATATTDKKDIKLKEEKKKATPTSATASKSRASRELISRSASQAQEKIDERVKTPIVLNDQQIKNKSIFMEKAYIYVHLILSKMIDNIESVFQETLSKEDNIKILEKFIIQKQISNFVTPINSDFID